MKKRSILVLVIAVLFLSACGKKATPEPALDLNVAVAAALATVNASYTQTALAVPTVTPTITPTPVPPTPTVFAPSVTLPVTIKVAANCRFGPSTTYASPGGLRTGKALEAIGRDTSGQWLLLREPGGKKACWVNMIALSVQGDPSTLDIAPVELLLTEDYPPPPNIAATRNSDQVQISWGDVPLQPKDTYLDSHYFLELWLCNNGQLTYTVLATNDLTVVVTDQPGCSETSHGLLYTATKLGYSVPATIPWP